MKKKKIRRWLVLALLLVLIGWGISFFLKPAMKVEDGTNTNPVAYSNLFFKLQLRYFHPDLEKLLYAGDGRDTYVVPGLEEAKAIEHTSGKIGEATDMDPQGLTLIEDRYVAISAYSKSKNYNSVIFLLDKETGKYIKTLALNNTDHVGGISYDAGHQTLWVATVDEERHAQVSSITLETIEDYQLDEEEAPITFKEVVDLEGIKRTSYLVARGDRLYTGYFDPNEQGKLEYYPIDETGRLQGRDKDGRMIPAETWETNERVQGMSFYGDKVVFSESYGVDPSQLLVFQNHLDDSQFDFDENMAEETITLPAFLEQIVGYEDTLYLLFESAQEEYREIPMIFHGDRVLAIHFETPE